MSNENILGHVGRNSNKNVELLVFFYHSVVKSRS